MWPEQQHFSHSLSNMPKIVKLLLSIILCLGIGFGSSFFTISSIQGWYSTIVKPGFLPPNWVFGPVWTILYILMGVSLFLVWASKKSKKNYNYFFIQLGLNFFWSFIFFGLHLPLLAFIEIIFLWISILLTILTFQKVSKSAAFLLYPYILWVSFASILNISVAILNP